MLEVGCCTEIECIDLTIDGKGIAKRNGEIVFVPDFLPGEKAKIRIISKRKGIFEGIIQERLVQSDQRCAVQCPYFGICGGCDCMHLEYASQLTLKRKRIRDCFTRICGVELEIPPVLSVSL